RIYHSSTGGTARVVVSGKGELNLSIRDVPEVAIGSIEGDGIVTGAVPLIVGSNNLSTAFSGVIETGSLIKVGRGQLLLGGASTYIGGTLLKHGGLRVGNTTGSATGTGPVQVSGGTLSGNGIIAGSVTVGNRQNRQAQLTPGNSAVGFLTIQNTL